MPYNTINVALAARVWLCGFLLVTVLVSCSRSGSGGDGITMAGSTSVQPFAEKVAEHYMRVHPESIINVQGGGSSAGIQAVRSGAAQLGMSSRALSDQEEDLFSVTIATDAIAIVVHPSNPITNIALDNLRDIFAGTVNSWQQVGGRAHKIHFITREEGSGTRDAFEHMVMRKKPISMESMVQDSNGAVFEIVANDPNAVGYVSYGILNDRVKTLAIDNIAPTVENFQKKAYKLIRPFLFVANATPTGQAGAFIDYVLGKEGQSLLKQEGLVPVRF